MIHRGNTNQAASEDLNSMSGADADRISKTRTSLGVADVLVAYPVNGLLGTLRVPGAQLHDVGDLSGFSEKMNRLFHYTMTQLAPFKPLSHLRCWMMSGLQLVCDLVSKVEQAKTPAYRRDPEFIDKNGQRISLANLKSKTIFFPGSGIDENRKLEEHGIREFKDALSGLIGAESGAWRDGFDPVMYLYQSDTRSGFSKEWFQRLKDAYRLNLARDYVSVEARNFALNVLVPLVSRDGARLDVETAKRNMRLNLVGQSYGGTFLRMVQTDFANKMRIVGYEEGEIQEIFDNVLVVNISGACRPRVADEKTPQFKEISIMHVYDFIGFQTDLTEIHPYSNLRNRKDLSTRSEDKRQGIPSHPRCNEWTPVNSRSVFWWDDFKRPKQIHTTGKSPDGAPQEVVFDVKGIEKPPSDKDYGFHSVWATTHERYKGMRAAGRVFQRALAEGDMLPGLYEMIGE